MSSEPTDNPSDQPGRFDSPTPDSWATPVPESWSGQPWSPQPDGSGAPLPPPWPGQQDQQPPQPGGSGAPLPPPWPGQQDQQPPQPDAPASAPAAADQQTEPAGTFAQGTTGPYLTGGQQPPDGQYPPSAQYPPDGQHQPSAQYPPDGQHQPSAQYPSYGQYPPGGQYGYDPRFYAPVAQPANRTAIAALVCGIGQFVLGLLLVGNILLAIPAIICGAIALKQIRLRGERGHGMAVAGLVLGILGVVYFVLIIIVIAVGMSASSHQAIR